MVFLKRFLLGFMASCLISSALADSNMGVGGNSTLSDKPIVIGYTDSKSFFSDKKIQDYLNQGLKHPIVFHQYQDRCHLLSAVKSGDVDLFYGHMPELYSVSNNNLPYFGQLRGKDLNTAGLQRHVRKLIILLFIRYQHCDLY